MNVHYSYSTLHSMLPLYGMFSAVFIIFSWLDFVTCDFLLNDHRNTNITDIKFEAKIVGGEPIQIENYPFAVQFLNMGRLCGGVIINSWSVLTAAHCLEFNADINDMLIQAGSKYTYDFTSDRYQVLSFVIHEDYNKKNTFSCDIALLFVRKPIQFSDRVKKSILVKHGKWMKEREKNFTVTGWGYTKFEGEVSKVGLQMARLRYVKSEECSRLLDGHKISADMFCLYGDGERDTCQGDSGGGVLWNDMLVGLTSHGQGCSFKDKPSVYTNVWFLRKWIINRVHEFVEQCCDGRFRFNQNN